ncbi:MAG: hypothetical protein IJ297_07235 [Clostridia bacterium]|nr:hypothetical protein [Clostridia bacterium]
MVEKIKKAIKPLYTDVCNVYEKKPVTREGRTQFEEALKYKSIPCRISAKAYLFGENSASERNNLLKVSKKVKLFVPPEYVIEPGSRVEVVRNGRKTVFGKSGYVSFYTSHNEVMLELLKNYA